MKIAADLTKLNENDRIELIGKAALDAPATSADKPPIVGFVVDDEEKADRYVRKLRKRFPTIRIIDRMAGPVVGTVLVRVGPPLR